MKTATKTNITKVLIEEHQLILRMIALLEANAQRAERAEFQDWDFFATAINFIRNFADRFHHAKEEDVLFAALVHNGMPEKRSPIEAMHIEHEQGREHVRGMETALTHIQAGKTDQIPTLVSHARGYATLLRQHIEKEDTILYPLAERVLPESARPDITQGYAHAEAEALQVEQKYRSLVEDFERRYGV
ncbi:MAG: hemerythrin domain-containing protein [Desulfuromonadaceae bacterium]|nr:hemerythrin domain-containing protein [Desulfuromonadaceae bacterium]